MPIPSDIMDAKLLEWCCGDKDAAAYLHNIASMVRLADDLADGDTTAPVPDMAHLLQRATVLLPSNPFFQRHQATLSSVWSVVVNAWLLSETWAKSDDETTRIFAFVRREDVETLLAVVATICGGPDHARRVMADIHLLSHAGGETFADWEAEHGHVRG